MIKESVKDKIISAASELFYFEGYNQTGINRILEEAQVSKDSMYRHFRSKEAIAVAYLEKRHQAWMFDLKNSLASKLPGKERVIAIFDNLILWVDEVDYRGCGFQNIITDIPKNQNSIKEMVRFSKTDIHQFIYDELKNNYTNEMDAKEVSNEVMVLIEGAIMLSQIQKNGWPIVSAKKACVKVLK